MAVRQCPQCLEKVPAGHAVARTDGIECPGCKAQLEVSAGSRYLATLAGLAAAVLVWRQAGVSAGMLGWLLPMVYVILAFSVVSPLVLMLIADLRIKSAEGMAEPEQIGAGDGSQSAGTGHGGGHR